MSNLNQGRAQPGRPVRTVQHKKRGGCWLWLACGCLAVVLAIVVCGVGGFVAYKSGAVSLDTVLNLIDEEDNGVAVVCHNRTEADMRDFLRHPAIMVGSDGTAISTAMTGSSSTGGHCGMPSRLAVRTARRDGPSGTSAR